MALTLGSLFDGSGGFPLAAVMCGITPVWASEIDPFCVAVTSKRFPEMKHLGDITKINGAEIPPVDIITFGSPCQDLSVAGNRAGLDGSRSSLFLEAIRIFKEMRESTNGVYPAVVVWENVPGAYSSHKGEDFRRVLEEIAGVVDPAVSVPRPAGGKWNACGCAMGDGYSIAWRTLDAQYWGVPQRRKRIFLVADFRGGRAPEILFKREGLRGNFKARGEAWEKSSAAAESCFGVSDFAAGFKGKAGSKSGSIGYSERLSPTLQAEQDTHCLCYSFYPQMKAESQCFIENKSNTLVNGTNPGFHNAVIYDCRGNVNENTCPTITGDHNSRVTDYTAISVNIDRMIVRRLMPVEEARLQGFPDWWCADVPHKDTPEYRMWGNGVALPCVLYVMEGITECMK